MNGRGPRSGRDEDQRSEGFEKLTFFFLLISKHFKHGLGGLLFGEDGGDEVAFFVTVD